MAKKKVQLGGSFEAIFHRLEILIEELRIVDSGSDCIPHVDAAIRKSVALLEADDVRPGERSDLCELAFEMIRQHQRDAFRTLRGLGREGHYGVTIDVLNDLVPC